MQMLALPRRAAPLALLALPLALAGCQEKYEMVTAALDSVSAAETSLTGTGTGTTEADPTETGPGDTTESLPTTTQTPETTQTPTTTPPETSTTSVMTTTEGVETTLAPETTTWDPGATTGAPVECEAPEDCTSDESGDLSAFVLPFFRGEVCVSDTIRPGDALALSINPCVHPCIDPAKLGWRYIFRCAGGQGGCEVAFSFYYREATGDSCPKDAFGKFNADKCKYIGPHPAAFGPIEQLGNEGDNLLIPFLTNDDAEAVSMMEAAAMVWDRIDGHTQAEERRFPLSVDAGNPAAPEKCEDGVAGCTCRTIGL